MPIILIIGGVIIALGVGAFVYLSATENTTPPPATSETEMNIRVEDTETMDNDVTVESSSDETTQISTKTYQADGEYLTPARTRQTIELSLTLTDGIVTDSVITFDGKAVGQSSNDNQARFADAYKAQVIGKPLAEISLSRVGGASLTSRTFNEAVAKIATQAAMDDTL